MRKELRGGATHSPAEHTDGVRNIWARLRRAIKDGAQQRHVLAVHGGVRCAVGLGKEGGFHVLGQVLGGGCDLPRLPRHRVGRFRRATRCISAARGTRSPGWR
eukprot:930577-Pleurochrysis_carterae.AAC.7